MLHLLDRGYELSRFFCHLIFLTVDSVSHLEKSLCPKKT
jgi:hypothetical protein